MIKILFSLLIGVNAQSTTTMTIEGIVTQFNEKTIQLKQKNGVVVIVPRSSKKTMKSVKLGKDVITVNVGSADFLRLNAHFFEKKESKK